MGDDCRRLVGFILVAVGCSRPPPAADVPAATVTHPVAEIELTTVRLTQKAQERLGIRTGPVEKRPMARTRTLAGDLVVPTGRAITVSAPMAGTVLAPGGAMPIVGAVVKKGQVIVRLVPLPSAADLASAQTRLSAARKRADRTRQLLTEGAVSERANEEAQTELSLAEANASASRPEGVRSAKDGALAISSPQDGLLRDVRVGAGQSIASGALLFQVDAVDELWVRVALYAGDHSRVSPTAEARISALASAPGSAGRVVRPAAAPPSADPNGATVDLFFALDNRDHAFQPGQRVQVALPYSGTEEALVVDWSSVVHDIQGGTWVYEALRELTYARRRVEVRYLTGTSVVLARGPPPGTQIVTVGAAELFGTEFFTGK